MSENDAAMLQENNQEQEPEVTMESLMGELLDAEGVSIDIPTAGEIRDGIIASLSDNQILVSIGAKSEGIIAGKEFEAIPKDILATFEEGKAIPVYVITPEDHEGNLILSFIRAVEEQSWQDAEDLLKSAESFESTVAGYNKGGLIVPLSTIRGFIPASQLSLSRRLSITGGTPEEKFKEFVGQPVQVCVIEVDRQRQRLILSERAASTETRDQIRDKILDDLHEGDVRKGRVTSLADFGAFVNIGGVDGLIHLSELSWDRLEHPSEQLKVGDEIDVKVISIDRDRRRIGLSRRAMQENPWSERVKSLKIGQLVEGEITRLTNFGAFAKLNLPGDLEGLIHISELSEDRIEHPKQVLKPGDVVTLRILKIEEEDQRIGLSLRRVDSPAYADMDWKTLVESYNLGAAGETIGDRVEEAVEEPTFLEKAADVVEEKVVEPVKDAVGAVVEKVKDILTPDNEVETVVEEATESIADKAEDAVENGKDIAQDAGEAIADAAENVVEKGEEVVEGTAEFIDDAADKVAETAEDVVENGKEIAQDAGEAIADAAENVVEKGEEVVEGTAEFIDDAADKVAETAEDVVETVKDKVEDAADAVEDAIEDK